MNYEEYVLRYKYFILINAIQKGWEIHRKNKNIYYLRKEKKENEEFNLEYEITLFHKEPFNIKKILNQIKNN